MDGLTLDVSALMRNVKQYADPAKHAELDAMLRGYTAKTLDKTQLQEQLRLVAGRDAIKQALMAMVPELDEIQKKREQQRQLQQRQQQQRQQQQRQQQQRQQQQRQQQHRQQGPPPAATAPPPRPAGGEPTLTFGACKMLLKPLLEDPTAFAFNVPVDWKKYRLNDYPKIVKTPMDLGTIKEKLACWDYEDSSGFIADVRLVWSNCILYNPVGDPTRMAAERLSATFEDNLRHLVMDPSFRYVPPKQAPQMDDGEVEFSHVRTREERDAEGQRNAIVLDADDEPVPEQAAVSRLDIQPAAAKEGERKKRRLVKGGAGNDRTRYEELVDITSTEEDKGKEVAGTSDAEQNAQLRAENERLRARVAELEEAVEAAERRAHAWQGACENDW